MQFYRSLGFLVFGSRLRRLGESFLSDVNRIYAEHNIRFDASWFPVFYLLSEKKNISIRTISDALNTSHSAASQLISSLQEKGLIKSVPDESDARKKAVTLTAKGEKLLQQIKPVWAALEKAMKALASEKNSRQILKSLDELEAGLEKESLFNRVEKIMQA